MTRSVLKQTQNAAGYHRINAVDPLSYRRNCISRPGVTLSEPRPLSEPSASKQLVRLLSVWRSSLLRDKDVAFTRTE